MPPRRFLTLKIWTIWNCAGEHQCANEQHRGEEIEQCDCAEEQHSDAESNEPAPFAPGAIRKHVKFRDKAIRGKREKLAGAVPTVQTGA